MRRKSVQGCAFLLAVLTGLSPIACQTTPKEEVVEEVGRPYYSPFREGGGLTAWVDDAIKRGIGLQIHPNVAPYPDNRVIDPKQRVSREELEAEGEVLSERVARLVGGWDRIADTSDTSFVFLEDLALDMSRFTEEPRYSEAVAATMMLYPELRAIYYPVTGGSAKEWRKMNETRGRGSRRSRGGSRSR